MNENHLQHGALPALEPQRDGRLGDAQLDALRRCPGGQGHSDLDVAVRLRPGLFVRFSDFGPLVEVKRWRRLILQAWKWLRLAATASGGGSGGGGPVRSR